MVMFSQASVILCVFEILQVPFAFESERLNGNLVTKKSPNYHSSDLDEVGQMAEWHLVIQLTFLKQPNVLLPNGHSADQTQTQMQMEPEACRMHHSVGRG